MGATLDDGLGKRKGEGLGQRQDHGKSPYVRRLAREPVLGSILIIIIIIIMMMMMMIKQLFIKMRKKLRNIRSSGDLLDRCRANKTIQLQPKGKN